jgi:uncharacterized protein YndB with AHSA1/START domain
MAVVSKDYRDVRARVYVNAPMDRIYKSWATVAGLERWFAARARMLSPEGRDLGREGPAEEGGRYSWQWADGTREDGTFIEVDNSTLLKFTYGRDVLVTVKLMLTSKGVLVDAHQHAQRSDAENLALALDDSNGWTFYLANLKSVLEHGADLREARPDVEGLVNV